MKTITADGLVNYADKILIKGEYPVDEYNEEFEVSAEKDGISVLLNGEITITWEWIIKAYREISEDRIIPCKSITNLENSS